MLSYLKFLLKSTNEHGVHSPFIFDYLTKCLYKKPKQSKDKAEDILFKSILYFNFNRITILGNPTLEEKLKNEFDHLVFGRNPIDILYCDELNVNGVLDRIKNNQLHNDSLIIVNHLNTSGDSWATLLKSEEITASMDCYSVGMLFLRKEQVKEHFIIRI